MNTLYIIIPAYNEEENIRTVVEDWYRVLCEHGGADSRLVVIDDGSRDNTRHILEECAGRMPQLIPITKPNGGHGAAVLYGYRYALEQGADYIFQTDSDGQTLPQEFSDFWAGRLHYDLLIGDRRARQDGPGRILVTRVLRLTLRLIFGVRIRDANTPYRLMAAPALAVLLQKVPDDYNLTNVLLTVLYTKYGYRIKYLPITFRPRQAGQNSIHLRKIIPIGLRAVRDFRNIKKTL